MQDCCFFLDYCNFYMKELNSACGKKSQGHPCPRFVRPIEKTQHNVMKSISVIAICCKSLT